MPGAIAAAMAATSAPPPSPGGGDSLFGLHLPNLGLDQLPGMLGGAVKGLAGLVATPVEGAFTGNWQPAEQAYEGFGKGVLSGLYNTEAHVGGALSHLPVVGAPIGNFFNNTTNQWANYLAQTSGAKDDATQQAIYNQETAAASPSAYSHALVPTLINDVGSVALAGGVGEKLAGLGAVGEAAKATTAAESAARAGFTPEEIANATEAAKNASPLNSATAKIPILRRFTAGDLAAMPPELRDVAMSAVKGGGEGLSEEAVANRANLLRQFEATASPVKSFMRGVVSPLSRAATAADVADVAGAVKPEDAVATAEAEATPAAAEGVAPRVGPKQRAFEYRNAQPIADWAQSAVQKVPQPVRDILQTVEGITQSRGLKVVSKEQRRFVDSARRSALMGPEMKDAVDAATSLVGQRAGELGHVVRPGDADAMVAEEIVSRLAAQHGMGEALKSAIPEASSLIDTAMKHGGGVPPELMTPELEASIQRAVTQFHDVADKRYETLLGSRKGEQGLEGATSDKVMPTPAQAREMAAIDRDRQRLLDLVPRKRAELDRARSQTLDIAGKVQRAAAEHGRLTELVRDNRLRVASDVAERPDLFDPSKGINFLGDKSVAQIAQQLKQRLNESPAQLKARAVRVGRGIERDTALQDRIARLSRQGSALDKAQADLFDTITNERTPTSQKIVSGYGKLQTRGERLRNTLEHPSIAQVPGAWKPLWGSWQELRTELGKDPAMAEALAAMPEKFSEVIAKAHEYGLDPSHVASLSDSQVERLVNNPVQLFNRDRAFQTVTSGQRKVRTGAQARTQTLEALAAAQVDVVHEAAANEVVSYIERSIARPVLHDEQGTAIIPHGFHAWDGESGVRSFIEGKGTDRGTEVQAGNVQPKLMIPDNVYRTIRNMSGDFNHSMWTNLGKITNPWRALVLTYSPGWYLKHFIGHAVLATTQGVRLGDWAAAWASVRADQHTFMDKAMQAIAHHGGYTAEEVAPEGLHGVGGVSLYSDLTGEKSLVHGPNSIRGQAQLAGDTAEGGKLNSKAAAFRAAAAQVQRRMQRVNEVGDNLGRAAMYLSQRRAGVGAEAALQKSVEALVDYNDLAPFERSVVRSFVPFYAFQKGMFKIMSRLPIDHPVAAMAGMQLGKLNNELGGNLPSYYSGMVHIPGTNLNVNTRSFDPFADATSLATPQGIAAGMNPFIEIAMRNALGAPSNPFSKRFRVDEFGHAVPDTAPAAELGGIFTQVPLATGATGLVGSGANASKGTGRNALKLGGVSTYSTSDVQALQDRMAKAQLVTQAGNPYQKAKNPLTGYTGPGAAFIKAQAAANASSSTTGTSYKGPGARFMAKAKKGASHRLRTGRRTGRRSSKPRISLSRGSHHSARISSHSHGAHIRLRRSGH